MERVLQEFYCGECQGFFTIKLNMALNHEVEICCPNCGHEHRRCIVEGHVYESGRYQTNSKEKIRTSKASYTKDPITEKMKTARSRRDGVEIVKERDPLSQAEFAERWSSVAARERGDA